MTFLKIIPSNKVLSHQTLLSPFILLHEITSSQSDDSKQSVFTPITITLPVGMRAEP